jgi:hypothetical protein
VKKVVQNFKVGQSEHLLMNVDQYLVDQQQEDLFSSSNTNK